MGMDFKNREGEWFQMRGVAWRLSLMLAEKHGWKAKGTLPPEDEKQLPIHLIEMGQPLRCLSWATYRIKKVFNPRLSFWDKSDYYTNEGQQVIDEDAQALSEALALARDAVIGTKLEEEFFPDPERFFTPIIVYLRKGGFSIH